MRFRLSARFLRTFLALIVSGVLMYNLLLLKAEAAQNKRELAFNLTAVSWKISETIFEAKRLEVTLHDYISDLGSREDVVLKTELLWSRLGVLRGEELPLPPDIIASLENLNQTLIRWEHDVYDAPTLTVGGAQDYAKELALRASQIRSLWISGF